MGPLVGPLVDPLVDPLVGPLVGRGSLSPVLCIVHLWALRARNRKKVSKRVFRRVWRKLSKSTRKSLKKPKNTQKGPKIGIFRPFRVFFETFLQTPTFLKDPF